jgi:hypothetical protein
MSDYCFQVRKIAPCIEYWTGKTWTPWRWEGKTYTARGIQQALYELRRHYSRHGCTAEEIESVTY